MIEEEIFTYRTDIKKEFCYGENELKGGLDVAEFLM